MERFIRCTLLERVEWKCMYLSEISSSYQGILTNGQFAFRVYKFRPVTYLRNISGGVGATHTLSRRINKCWMEIFHNQNKQF